MTFDKFNPKIFSNHPVTYLVSNFPVRLDIFCLAAVVGLKVDITVE